MMIRLIPFHLQEYGFVVEGTLRKSINGQDEWLLGCLKDEYKGKV